MKTEDFLKGDDLDRERKKLGEKLTGCLKREEAIRLIELGADVNAVDIFSHTALHSATIAGNLEKAEVLVAHGADLNARDNMQLTPLHHAARKGRKEVAELLIAKGADVEAKTKSGVTPLFLCASKDPAPVFTHDKGRLAVAELLVAHGADVNAKRKSFFFWQRSVLGDARLTANPGLIELLKKHGAV